MKVNKIYVTRNPSSIDSEIYDYAFKTYIGDIRKGTDHLIYYILGISSGSSYRDQWFEEEHRYNKRRRCR